MRSWAEGFNRVLDKTLSGRFLVTVMMSLTYCYLVSFIITKLSDKVSGDFALGFVSGFSTSFMLIIQWYFDKGDPKTKGDDDNAKEITISSVPVVSSDTSKS